ncbi:MAG: zf-HC2 domain-containing protein [Acidobacteria bacterium]|nr:zf-HC2 domain-containing protein [Acidobacteriota bacterium]
MKLDTTHLSESDFESYRRGSLAPEELLRVDDHLAACAKCRERLNADTAALMDAWRVELGAGTARRSHWRLAGIAAAAMLGILGSLWYFARRDAPATSREVARLHDRGAMVTLDSAGHLAGIAGLTSDQEKVLADAVQNGSLKIPPEVRALAGRRETLMGGESQSQQILLHPLATSVLEDRPMLRWKPVEGARWYQVLVIEEGSEAPLRSGRITETEWTVPQLLRRGSRYTWQLRATLSSGEVLFPAPPAPVATFSVASAGTAHRLAKLPDSRILRGVIYAENGLLASAQQQFEALLRDNPESDLVKNWLRAIHNAQSFH